MNTILRIFIPLLILVAGWLTMSGLAKKKEEPAREGGYRRENLPKVRTVELRRTDFGVTIRSNGVAQAHNSTSLTPRVSGRIEHIFENFENGAFFKTGDVLVELDSSDFNAAVAAAQARVARAEAVLAQEQARAEQALLDWKDLGYTDEPSALVKREPQLKEANANLIAAQAELSAAERDLERTKILAPYDGCVLRRAVGPGQSVGSSTALGEIFSTDFAEIRLPLKANAVNFFRFPEDDPSTPVQTTIFDALGDDSVHTWKGAVVRTEGALDESSRQLFVITRVEDPYGLDSDHAPLRIGLPVVAEIEGRVLKDVFVLPGAALRNPREIVLVNPEDSTLQRTKIEPIWEEEDVVIVRDDLPENWHLVVSQLPYAANGSKVEIVNEESEEDKLKAAQRPNPTKSNSGS